LPVEGDGFWEVEDETFSAVDPGEVLLPVEGEGLLAGKIPSPVEDGSSVAEGKFFFEAGFESGEAREQRQPMAAHERQHDVCALLTLHRHYHRVTLSSELKCSH